MRQITAALLATLSCWAGPTLAQPVPPLPPAEQEFMYQGQASSILGRQVRDPAGDAVGRIIDVLVDDTGLPRAAVVDFGGFMGVGNRRIAVSWRALHFGHGGDDGSITLEMTGDQIKAVPDFRRPAGPADPPVAVAVPPRAAPP